MESLSSVSCPSCSFRSSLPASPADSDGGCRSDSDGENTGDAGAPDPQLDAARQKGGHRPSPGPGVRRPRPALSRPQRAARCLEQRGLAAPMAAPGVKRSRGGHSETALAPEARTTEGDLLFARKCEELQGFIRPLTALLDGLKMGRFERGLSSFQQSVAMDRIQRIVGVLQKPQMGERYLGTLLQVEGMLKTWFPQVAAQKSPPGSSGQQPTRPLRSHPRYPAASSPDPPMGKLDRTQRGRTVLEARQPWHLTQRPVLNLTWTHTTPICNPPLSTPAALSSGRGPSDSGSGLGVSLLLQQGVQPSARSAPATPALSAAASPGLPGGREGQSGEGSRCRSLPVTLPSDRSRPLSPPAPLSAAGSGEPGRSRPMGASEGQRLGP